MMCIAEGPDGADDVFIGGGTGLRMGSPRLMRANDGAVYALAIANDHAIWVWAMRSSQWGAPISIGGDFLSIEAACVDSAGALHFIALDRQSLAIHIWLDGSSWRMVSLFEDNAPLRSVDAIPWKTGLLALAVRSDGHLYEAYLAAPEWNAPTLHPVYAFDGFGFDRLASIAAASVGQEAHVWCVREDASLIHARRLATPVMRAGHSLIWSRPVTMGTGYSTPVAVVGLAGRAHVVSANGDGALSHAIGHLELEPPRTSDGLGQIVGPRLIWEWSPRIHVDGGHAAATPTVAVNGTRLYVAASDPTTNRLAVAIGEADSFSNEFEVGGGMTFVRPIARPAWKDSGANAVGRPAMLVATDDTVDLVYQGEDGTLRHNRWKSSSEWTGEATLLQPCRGQLRRSNRNHASPPDLLWWDEVAVPAACGGVRAIAVDTAKRRIVLATYGGLYWSAIPGVGASTTFGWQQAVGLPAGAVGDVTAVGGGFAVAALGPDWKTGRYGLFRCYWQEGQARAHRTSGRSKKKASALPSLRAARASTAPLDARELSRVVVGSTPADVSVVYAAAADLGYDSSDAAFPLVASDGVLNVFVRGKTGNVEHVVLSSAGTQSTNLGGTTIDSVCASEQRAGQYEIFATFDDRTIRRRAATGNGMWTIIADNVFSAPTAGRTADGEIRVFATGDDGALVYVRWPAGQDATAATMEPRILSGFTGVPAIASVGDETHVVAAHASEHLFYGVVRGNGLGPFTALGATRALFPSLAVTTDGAIHLVAIGVDGNLIHRALRNGVWQVWTAGGWTSALDAFTDVGGTCRGRPAPVAVGNDLHVFVRGTDDCVYKKVLSSNGWSEFAATVGGDPGKITSHPAAVVVGNAVSVIATSGARLVQMKDPFSSLADLATGLYPARAGDGLRALLRSVDGGRTFRPTRHRLPEDGPGGDLRAAAGNQGYHNAAIAVSPRDPSVVAVGWRSGPFLSMDAGETFQKRMVGGELHLHSDIHQVMIGADGVTLYCSSDGGVAVSADLGKSWRSDLNRMLPVMQFGPFDGTGVFADVRNDGIVLGALQDNGIVWARPGSGTGWIQHAQSDGVTALFSSTGEIVYRSNVSALTVARFNGRSFSDVTQLPLTRGDVGLWVEASPVRGPAYRDPTTGDSLIALSVDANEVYGVFASTQSTTPHRWEKLLTFPVNDVGLTYAFSIGSRLWAGTSHGTIYDIDVRSQTAKFLPIARGPLGRPSYIHRIVMVAEGEGYAIGSRGALSYVLRWDGSAWTDVSRGLPEEGLAGLAVDSETSPATVYVCTDSRVYSSPDRGGGWRDVSSGLPRRPHLGELIVQRPGQGNRRLYVSTWGRGVFSAEID